MRLHRSRTILCVLLLSAPGSGGFTDEPATIRADMLLRGGTVIDGGKPTGDPPRVADVAIRGDEIVAVGDGETVDADWVIDCEGLVVAPGFIDLHNHSDRQMTEPATRGCVNYLTQGCTTIVTGNCGGGVTDVSEYYDQIDRHGAGVNVAHLVPHGSIRRIAMGGSKDRRPTDDELARLRELADKGMREGAWGMSTGLIYTPGSYAETEELIEVARAVAGQGGIYVSHMRDEGPGLLRSVEETLRIGREASLPVHISHFKARGEQAWGLVRLAAQMVDEAREAGQVVTADQCFGTFTRKLGHYAVREKVVSLEQAVHSGAGLPAEILGITDRGLLRPGQRADVIVFDPERVIDNATFEAPFRHSDGIVHVFVNGTPAVHDGVPSGALAGRSLRHALEAPSGD